MLTLTDTRTQTFPTAWYATNWQATVAEMPVSFFTVHILCHTHCSQHTTLPELVNPFWNQLGPDLSYQKASEIMKKTNRHIVKWMLGGKNMPCVFIYIRRILSIRYRNIRGQTITTTFDLEEVKSSSALDKNSSYLIYLSLSLCHQPPFCKTHSTHPALTLSSFTLSYQKFNWTALWLHGLG